MNELNQRFRELACELLGIDSQRPLQRDEYGGLGLQFFTTQEFHELQMRICELVPGITWDHWDAMQVFARIKLIEQALNRQSVTPNGAARGQVEYLGNGQLRLADGRIAGLDFREAVVLEALLAAQNQQCSTKQLEAATPHIDDPARLLRGMVKKHNLQAVIYLPGGKGRGGYSTTIVDNSKIDS